jgi:hypothetical protein
MSTTEQSSVGVQPLNGDSKIHQHLSGKCDVLVVQDGLPTQTRVNAVNNRDGKIATAGTIAHKPTFPLFGQDGWVSNDFKGQLDRQTLAGLQTNLVPDISIYPGHDVAIGEEWKGDPQAVAKQFNIQFPNETATVTMKLVSLQQIGDRSAAEVSVSATADLRSLALKTDTGLPPPGDVTWGLLSSPDIKTQISMDGTCLIDLRTGIPLKTTMKGTITTKGRTQGFNGQAVKIKIDGTMDVSSSATLTGAGNNAAAAPSPAPAPAPAPKPSPAINGGGNPLGGATEAANYAGKFTDGSLSIDLQGAGPFSGTITRGQDTYHATASVKNAQLEGSFEAGGQNYPFTATLSRDTLIFKTGAKTYTLKKQGNPLGDAGQKLPRQLRITQT